MNLHIYLPQDRLHALAQGKGLPDRTYGSALFADISGFTSLTETLRNALGARRGAEELTRILETVYSALIARIEEFGGSVISFAGDSMLCWFDSSPQANEQQAGLSSAPLAVACAQALQKTMQMFTDVSLPDQTTTALTLKVAIATGPARRFIVGDPNIHLMDALAGATIARTALAEHLTQKGEILLDAATTEELSEGITIQEWRLDPETQERFTVLEKLTQSMETPRLPPQEPDHLPLEEIRPWLPHLLVEREKSQGSFLSEFRPCAVLFVRFIGIDFDCNEARTQLDLFIRLAQDIVRRYDGMLVQTIIGDKGSYAYINFGMMTMHEDDERRAVKTALELREAARGLGFLQPLQIGLTQGTLLVGANGGQTRKTFGAMGDDVNLAARLMQTASPGEILLSERVHKAIAPHFVFEPRPPLPLKGKAEPLPIFALTGERKQRAIRLQEPTYALPMVGREKELQIIEEKLDLAVHGQAQVIGVTAEAGLGKSRLVAEVIRLAHRKGFAGYGGACQSDGVHTPYLVWKSIWGAFFDVDPAAPLRKQLRLLEGEIEDRTPARVQAMPLLNSLLDLDIPDNDFTYTLAPQDRKGVLHALFEDCLRAEAQETPLLIVVEDAQWIDALSHDLLEALARALADCPICFVLAYRPPQIDRLLVPRLEALPVFTRIELRELERSEAEQAIRAKLALLYPARTEGLPPQLVDRLMERAQGNPFYLEELLNYLHDRGLDPRDPTDLEKIELPDSLHTLVLSRLDQLSEREKLTLRVASVIGRMFYAAWLAGYYPVLGEPARIKNDLDQFNAFDITLPDETEPELAYLFKHIVLHEVTYESLPFTLREQLHELLARYLERQIASGALPEAALLDTLVFHYAHTRNQSKQREYLRKAGEAAQKTFANEAALAHYGQLLPLLDEAQKTEILLRRGAVLELTGVWDEAEVDYRLALDLAQSPQQKANAQFVLGRLYRERGNYETALEYLAQAKAEHLAREDRSGLVQVMNETATLFARKGEYVQAQETANEALTLAREVDDKGGIAWTLSILGNLADSARSDFSAAQALYEECLRLRRESGDKRGIAKVLNNLGVIADYQGDFPRARALYEESYEMEREIGDKDGMGICLTNLGCLELAQGNIPKARSLFTSSLALSRKQGAKLMIANDLMNLGNVYQAEGDSSAARAAYEDALGLCREIGDKLIIDYALLGLGITGLATAKGEPAALTQSRQYILESLHRRQEAGQSFQLTASLIGMAGYALHTGNTRRAAQLLGTVDAALKALNAKVEVDILHFHTQTLAATRAALTESEFQSAWDEGTKLSLEDAIQLAEEENP
ncbi:MAG TPA: tetratricopeptide repeat protein [Anaerolineales bacterium]|nr:tetratricopeptide repeat protein [Anaerolineales bacterium]